MHVGNTGKTIEFSERRIIDAETHLIDIKSSLRKYNIETKTHLYDLLQNTILFT